MSNTKTDTHKKAMVGALKSTLGVVTSACEKIGVSRSTHYKWLKEDPEYAEAVEDLDNVALDFVESNLFRQIKNGNTTATIFFLKTRGKKRGYSQKQQAPEKQEKESSLRAVKNF